MGPQEREQGLEGTALWGVSADSDGENPRMVPPRVSVLEGQWERRS